MSCHHMFQNDLYNQQTIDCGVVCFCYFAKTCDKPYDLSSSYVLIETRRIITTTMQYTHYVYTLTQNEWREMIEE